MVGFDFGGAMWALLFIGIVLGAALCWGVPALLAWVGGTWVHVACVVGGGLLVVLFFGVGDWW